MNGMNCPLSGHTTIDSFLNLRVYKPQASDDDMRLLWAIWKFSMSSSFQYIICALL